jgi:hypothetical protein
LSELKSKDVCSSCGGELDCEGNFHNRYRRFEQYRCKSCKMPVEFDIDPLIKNEVLEIEEVSIEVLNREAKAPSRFDKNSHDVLLCCWNPKCTQPGILIGLTLREMLDKHETHREYWEFCRGVELSPKGRKRTPCDQSFKITIDIVLKNNEVSGGQF